MDLPIREAADLLRHAQMVLLTTHIQPDPDGLGCELALAETLESLGKRAVCINADPVPERFRFLNASGRIQTLAPTAPPEADPIVVVDTGVWSQLGAMAEVIRNRRCPCLVIDHHRTTDPMSDGCVVEPEAPSAGWIILRLIDELQVPLTASMASALFASLVHDTGWLRFNNANLWAYEMAARLNRAGARPHEIYLSLEERLHPRVVRLLGLMLGGLELHCSGGLVAFTITNGMLAEAGAAVADTHNLINHAYTLQGVHSAVLFVEQPDGHVKISLRSRGVVDVNRLAGTYGGGGHERAAGARLPAPIDAARRRVISDLCQCIDAAQGPTI